MKRDSLGKRVSCCLLTILPVAVYFLCFFYYGIDAPQFDDFQTVVRSVITFDTSTNYAHWLFAQYGEHRIAYVRLVALLVQRITGHIDFVWMGLIGNLSLLGVIGVIARWFKRWQVTPYFLPVPFILFQLQYHHNTFTAMMALQNLTILLWAFLTFWWVADGRGWRPWVALLTALLAVYTSGNGLFVVLTALLMLALRGQWRLFTGWAVVGGLAVAGYFWHLVPVKSNYSISYLLTHIPQFFTFTVFFCGSYFDLFPNVLMSSITASSPRSLSLLFYLRLVLPLLTGAFMITAGGLLISRWCFGERLPAKLRATRFAHWLARSFSYHAEANVFLAACTLFILLTAGVVALGRIDVGLAQSFAIRYKVYAPLLLILLYAAFVVNTRHTANRLRFQYILLPVSLLISVNSYWQHLHSIHLNRQKDLTGLYNMNANRSWAVYGSEYGNIDSVMQAAIRQGIYQLNPAYLRHFSTLRADLRKQWPIIPIQFDTTRSTARLEVPRCSLTPSLPNSAASDGAYFILHNQHNTYLFAARFTENLLGVSPPSFQCAMGCKRNGLLPGLYQIAVMTRSHGQQQLFSTVHQLNLQAR